MANHVRQQIRDALAIRLTGLSTTAARAYKSRVYPLSDSELPCLLIKNGHEDSVVVTLGSPGEMQRTLDLQVQAVAKASASVDDTLDTICKEIEAAVASEDTLGGLVSGGLALASTDFEISGELERPCGIATMTWRATYYTFNNAPDVAR